MISQIKKRHKPLHYFFLLVVMCVCINFAFDATFKLTMFNKQGTLTGLNAKEVVDYVENRFNLINDINFYSHLFFCASAAVLYVNTKSVTAFLVDIISYFIILCVTYFWVVDGLFMFQKQHGLSEGGFSAGLIFVTVKLVAAIIFTTLVVLLVKAILRYKKM